MRLTGVLSPMRPGPDHKRTFWAIFARCPLSPESGRVAMSALCREQTGAHDEFVPLRTQKLSSLGELGQNADLCCGSQVSRAKWG